MDGDTHSSMELLVVQQWDDLRFVSQVRRQRRIAVSAPIYGGSKTSYPSAPRMLDISTSVYGGRRRRFGGGC